MNKPKTINIYSGTHEDLRNYCNLAGLKMHVVADKAIAAWLKKNNLRSFDLVKEKTEKTK